MISEQHTIDSLFAIFERARLDVTYEQSTQAPKQGDKAVDFTG